MAKQTDFIAYVRQRLKERSWTRNKLATEAGLSSTLVNKVLSPKNVREGIIPVSQNFCTKVAAALAEPPEKLLALAGYLEQGTETTDEVLQISKNLEEGRLSALLRFSKFLLSEQRIEENKRMHPHDRRGRLVPDNINDKDANEQAEDAETVAE